MSGAVKRSLLEQNSYGDIRVTPGLRTMFGEDYGKDSGEDYGEDLERGERMLARIWRRFGEDLERI